VDDRALVTQLLSIGPTEVSLVGKSVFRLNAMVLKLVGDASFCAPAPAVVQYERIDQFIDAQDGVSHNKALCIHLANDAQNPEKMLGAACRMSPDLVLVEHSNSAPEAPLLDDARFFAFGFRRLGHAVQVSGVLQHWYAFSLRDYKQSPDWLNARFWAHPERFDLQE